MKQAMINYIQSPKNDELYTPTKAVVPLLPFLPRDKVYWECTDFGKSNISKVLKSNGFRIFGTHISKGFDFLKDDPKFYFDIIITNPPYSLKNQFLKRAYELGKPFAFLLPLTTLEGVYRGKLFRKYGIQLLVMDKRINFMKDKKSCWFNTSWFCWKILPKDLIFVSIDN